ncbi:hypothetical protein ACFXDF_42295 [Streptomyces sp. NPDC059426]|uniref:hypothetical protein n=1 Tax=unclassified Streptomyces TaxID=2593676 RepID=UPI0036B6618E
MARSVPESLAVTSNDEVTQVLPAADLTGVTVADATTVTVGQTVTYRVAARDRGPNQSTGVTLTDRLPDNLALSAGPSHARLPQPCQSPSGPSRPPPAPPASPGKSLGPALRGRSTAGRAPSPRLRHGTPG